MNCYAMQKCKVALIEITRRVTRHVVCILGSETYCPTLQNINYFWSKKRKEDTDKIERGKVNGKS